MLIQCSSCFKPYDDATHLTFCPHDRFISDETARRKDRAVRLLGQPIKFIDDPDDEVLTLKSIGHDGQVTVKELPGASFGPECFEIIGPESEMERRRR